MLIYKLLGDQVQSEFARSWGVSYGARRGCEATRRWLTAFRPKA